MKKFKLIKSQTERTDDEKQKEKHVINCLFSFNCFDFIFVKLNKYFLR